MGERLDSYKQLVLRHKVLSVLLGLYLALSAVELVRILLYDRPREYDARFYQWESAQTPEGPRDFHWTRGDKAYVLRPLWAPVVRIPLYLAHPSPPPDGVHVRLFAEETTFYETRLYDNGWHRIDVYLPAVLGEAPWRRDPDTMRIEGVARLDPVEGEGEFAEATWTLEPTPDYIRVFTEWHPPPGPPSRWFELRVEPTFRPSEYAEVDDDRELGVGVGEFLWRERLPPEGIGFYPLETQDVRPFRWSRERGSLPVAVPATEGDEPLSGRIWVRAPGPDVAERPVIVELWWGPRAIASVSLSDNDWHPVELEVDPGQRQGVVTVRPSRTWNPARAGVSADARDLGVAVSEIEWEH